MSICNYSASAGMLFGVYTDRGPTTCAGRPAAQGFEAVDATTYANWTVDYLKEDSVCCSLPPPPIPLPCLLGSRMLQPLLADITCHGASVTAPQTTPARSLSMARCAMD